MAIKLEGILHKWTNYLNGWQPRWFVLENGVLSYYRCEDEVDLGCRGSYKMASCEISICPTDLTRIDLFVPPGQYIYMKATTQAERQKWLVALGSSKACITSGAGVSSTFRTRNPDVLKFKLEEIHHYRVRLLQYVYAIKFNLSQDNIDVQALDQNTTQLTETCDTFLDNVDALIKVLDARSAQVLSSSSEPSTPTSVPIHLVMPGKPVEIVTESNINSARSSVSSFHSADGNHSDNGDALANAPPSVINTVSSSLKSKSTMSAKVYTDKIVPKAKGLPVQAASAGECKENSNMNQKAQVNHNNNHDRENKVIASDDVMINVVKNEVNNIQDSHTEIHKVVKADSQQSKRPVTFFTSTSNRFDLITLTPSKEIPSQAFLAACTSIVLFLDLIGPTTFAPVKIDISGNIKKLQLKYNKNPNAYHTLQSIVVSEIEANTTTVKNSATDALLWLKRALEFIFNFLDRFCQGEQDLTVAANYAYDKTLRQFHGWVVRGVFSLACRAIPHRKNLVAALAKIDGEVSPVIEQVVIEDVMEFVKSLSIHLDIINTFYKRYNLDPSKVV